MLFMNAIFNFLIKVDNFFWAYIAFILIALLGIGLTIQSNFYQVRILPKVFKTFFSFLDKKQTSSRGTHPLRAFFASVGGMIGIGNIVGIVTAVQLGGPGALFWVWNAALIGTIIKYSEIFLGLTHRITNSSGGYDGGPMYFLAKAFKSRWIPILISILLCIYGVEIYQFVVITDSITANFSINRYIVIAVLLFFILYASSGGVPRIGKICSTVMPVFMILYVALCSWIIFSNISIVPAIFKVVISSAFTGHAAVGGFAGATVLLSVQYGLSKAAYSADIGIGYDSIIQSESSVVQPEKQAQLAILGVCLDNLICTMSILVALVSGLWKAEGVEASYLIQAALSQYFPYMNLFMPIFIFIVGYSTMISYFCVGIKCATFLNPKYGKKIFMVYGAIALVFFSFFDQTSAFLVVSLVQAMLLIINLIGIYLLRKQISFVLN